MEVPGGRPDSTTCYLFSYAKSGSTLMENLIADYCLLTGVPRFSLYDQAFSQGIATADIAEDALACFAAPGVVYSGFRHYPGFDLPIGRARVIMLVRDPRDMMVSLYYSMTRSHVIPRGNEQLVQWRERTRKMQIDEFALHRAPGYVKHFKTYQAKLEGANPRVFRYEDVIYSKADWLLEMAEYADLPIRLQAITELASTHDLIPERENTEQHVRQVHPGNFREKLKEQTIARLNEILAEFLAQYDYDVP